MAKTAKPKPIEIRGESQYPSVPINAIEIVERPDSDNETEVLFFNPRSMDSFDEESMISIRESIKNDGLQQPPVCRAFYNKNEKIVKIQLIAGERRLRSILKLVEDNEECYDGETQSFMPASELYEFIPVRLHHNISDERSLRLAFLENNESKNLTIREEIALVERLTKRGLSQKEIALMLLGKEDNVTWVSQTSNFRTALPPEAFEKLLEGKVTRNVAVKLMSYKPEERSKLYKEAVEAEESETKKIISELDNEIIEKEDLTQIISDEADEAEKSGNANEAKKLKKKIESVSKKAEKTKEKKKRVAENSGTIRQSHIDTGASNAGVQPKKQKPLSRQEVETHWMNPLDDWCVNGGIDEETGQELPEDLLLIQHGTIKAILSGCRDPKSVIREHMVEQGLWKSAELSLKDCG